MERGSGSGASAWCTRHRFLLFASLAVAVVFVMGVAVSSSSSRFEVSPLTLAANAVTAGAAGANSVKNALIARLPGGQGLDEKGNFVLPSYDEVKNVFGVRKVISTYVCFWVGNHEPLQKSYFIPVSFDVIPHTPQGKLFSSFLPGIAGPNGHPLWCFYINRYYWVYFDSADDDGLLVNFQRVFVQSTFS